MEILNYTLFEIGKIKVTVTSLVSLLVIFLLARLFIWSFKKLLDRRIATNAVDSKGKKYAILQIGKYLIYTLALLFMLESVGVELGILLTGSAALLVGIGFGLQNTFNDFLSGIILLFDGTVEVGDIVEVGGLVGTVSRIGLRTTQINTRDALGVIIPNSNFTNQQVVNWSHNQQSTRFNVTVGVAYGSDVPLVKKVLESCASNHKHILENPGPVCRFLDFGDSALMFEVLFWTNHPFWVEFTRSDIRYKIDEEFRKHNIKIPFPQRDLHVVSGSLSGI